MWDNIERRRNRMSDGFEPSSAFEGYVYAKLEGIEKKFDVLPCKTQDERLRVTEQKVSKMEGKASIYGAVMGFISGVLAKIFLGK